MTRPGRQFLRALLLCLLLPLSAPAQTAAQTAQTTPSPQGTPAAPGAAPERETLPALTQPVNDFARVIDPQNAAEIDRVCRALLAATSTKGIGDTIIVVTVPTFAPFGDIREYANKLFENGGRGIGDKQKDNGLLVVLAVNDRKVWIEVGYGLEGPITDGFSGETSRQYMAPLFKQGRYGDGLRAGVTRIAARIAQERGITLENVRPPEPARGRETARSVNSLGRYIFLAIVLFVVIQSLTGGGGRRRGPGGWSGWSGGVGPFGGGWGGGFGGGGGGWGGGGGGGFGGFGGGSSGGGGGGSSW
jgi:uncharacterized protein